MRHAVIVLAALLVANPVVTRSAAATTGDVDPATSLGVVQRWIYNYRARPDPVHVPAAVRVLFKAQTFKDPENSGIYLGFIAGAIGANPAKAEQLVDSFFPVPPEDEWVIVRAIAYSGLPDWKNLMSRVAPRMPGRKVMIDDYLSGKLPTLAEIPLEENKPGFFDKMKGAFKFSRDDKVVHTSINFANSQDLLDTLWGLLFRHRLARADLARPVGAGLGQEQGHHRQGDGGESGTLHAGELRGARRRLA